tara:strand:- start:481 stop:852 length:372 start_codon:yes stop_codon:yes gene_type:complete
MRTLYGLLLFTLPLISFASSELYLFHEFDSSKSSSISDTTFIDNPPEGIEFTEPHFIINERKFWIVINNKRSSDTYDENSAEYQFYSKIPKELLTSKENGISFITVPFKEKENTYAVIEMKNE